MASDAEYPFIRHLSFKCMSQGRGCETRVGMGLNFKKKKKKVKIHDHYSGDRGHLNTDSCTCPVVYGE